MNVDYNTNKANSRNTNQLSLFKAFFLHLTWVNLFSLSGKCFLGIIFPTVFFYFGIKPVDEASASSCLMLATALVLRGLKWRPRNLATAVFSG